MSYTIEQLETAVATERARCLKIVEDATESYLRTWTRIVGEDRAKATAWDFAQLRKAIGSPSNGDPR